ncbi:DNA polymerase I [Candidatus Uhrbacteria bacterium]|nr:DNA polymerase I [Candidatus Uhrbacteria bacterium]
MNKRFMIIDGNALLHRAWHALPPLTTQKGEVVNAVYGFTQILMKALKELEPAYCVVAFDKKGPTFRHEQYKAYKATRVKQPQELYDQIDRIKQILHGFGIPIFEKDGFEADDIIATLARRMAHDHPDTETVIVTGDMDTLQLVDDHTKVYTLKKSIVETTIFDEAAVRERYDGLMPRDLTLYKALRGDPSDNIPGVKGIGEKTAIELVKQFPSREALEDAVQQGDPTIKAKVHSLLKVHAEDFAMSYALVQLRYDVPIDFDIEASALKAPHGDVLIPLFQELEFRTLIPRLQSAFAQGFEKMGSGTNSLRKLSQTPFSHYQLLDTTEKIDAFLKTLSGVRHFAVDTETTSLNALRAELVGVSFSFEDGTAFFLPWKLASKTHRGALKAILDDFGVKKTGHNIKYDLHVLHNVGIELSGIEMDTMVGAYVENPGGRAYSLDAMSFQEFGHQKISIELLIGKGKQQISMADVPLEQLSEYACEDADYTWRLRSRVMEKLKTENLLSVCEKFEIPLIPILARMERRGVKIDVDFLNTLSAKLHKELSGLVKNIHALAGEEFNINSPIQLKKVLFETLAINAPKLKKGKTGISTAASELEKMRGLHPIIDEILEYRERAKLANTYVDALPKLIDVTTGRVHTSFNQTIAATGRLSSSDPNFQNIPIRTEMGREIRKSIVAQEGYILLAADYSQLELRIVASFAKDEAMLSAFREGKDIHAMTASAVQGVDIKDVTPQMRRAAKEVNFGIIYGMGPHGLARSTGISQDEARDFIDRYFSVYPGIAEYMDRTLVEARKAGYVETMFGRRRYIPELSSGMFQVRAAAERAAINMPIQGTGADIIKLAMIEIEKHFTNWIPRQSRASWPPAGMTKGGMILQVHDELVFEIPKGMEQELASLIKKEMESVVALAAPLVADVKVGANWGDMHALTFE